MLKQPDFFYSQPSTLSKKAHAKFYLSTTFGLRFMINSVAPTRSSTFYAYLITKIGNRNLETFHRFLRMWHGHLFSLLGHFHISDAIENKCRK